MPFFELNDSIIVNSDNLPFFVGETYGDIQIFDREYLIRRLGSISLPFRFLNNM